MGDLVPFPAPAGPPASYTDGIRGCWACGLVLFDDEHERGLCDPCDYLLNTPATPPTDRQKPLAWYLRHLGPDGLRTMAEAIVETGVTTAEEQAAEWARDHQLDSRTASTFVGDVRGRAHVEYSQRCHRDGQAIGELLGWGSR